jgi:hypothetical protein
VKTALVRWFRLFWLDESAFERVMRAVLFGWAVTGLGFADQLAAVVSAPGLVRAIKVSAIVCAALGAVIRAGDKNAPAAGGDVQ